MAVWWTKRSRFPSSGVMKPKPLSSLNHFTVPDGTCVVLHASCAATCAEGWNPFLRVACTFSTAGISSAPTLTRADASRAHGRQRTGSRPAGDAGDLGDRGLALADLHEPVVAPAAHPLLRGDRGDGRRGVPRDGEGADLLGHRHHLVQADAAPV